MRKTVRLHAHIGPEQRLATAIAELPASAQSALLRIADREDLPLVAGSWEGGGAGCLIANVVRSMDDGGTSRAQTFDLRVLDLLPELSSQDLNNLIVAWDEAADQDGRGGDPALRRMLRNALAQAGVALAEESMEEDRSALVGQGLPVSVVGADAAEHDLDCAALA